MAHAIVSAVSCEFVDCAVFPARSVSTTARASEHFPQTKMGIFSLMTPAKALLNGGQPTGVTLSATAVRISTVAGSPTASHG